MDDPQVQMFVQAHNALYRLLFHCCHETLQLRQLTEETLFGLSFSQIRVHEGRVGAWQWELGQHVFIYKQAHWEWHMAVSAHSRPPVTCFLW